MATLVLTAVGSVFGPVGAAIGGLLGNAIDGRLLRPKGREGPRLTELKLQTSSYGQPIPRLYGTMRVAGSVIWATDLKETRAKSGGGKGKPKADIAASRVTTIGVNSYLWRASLESLSFMPMLQTDSNGGVIVTDWYANPNNPGERMKVTVTILDQDLRADALRVAASRQVSQNGVWVDAPVQAATVQKLEDIILTKARDLRRSAVK